MLNKHKFYDAMQKNFEASVDQRKKTADELTNSITAGKEKLGITIFKGPEKFDELTQRKKEILTKPTNSNELNASFVEILSNPMKILSKIKNQFS